MRELQKSECDLACGGTQPIKYINGPAPGTTVTPLPGPIVTGYPLPPINFNTGTGSSGNNSYNNGTGNAPGTIINCGATLTGTHDVYDTTLTSKNTNYNNPGDISSGLFAERHGQDGSFNAANGNIIAEFPSEQDGMYALGCLLDGNYGTNSMANFASAYLGENASATKIANYTSAVEQYMTSFGYTNFQADFNSMSNDEFNTLMDGIAFAEGMSNMPPVGKQGWTMHGDGGC
ncbi:hypothetical protein [Metallibacterium scheffleri]|uniref:hypothetical protein n=1 Tax=Metallibacterium scheffleri TaxID=993689 RepID=UPI0010A0B134|nr:hypothetical protein [Metallibacterium scheffleri]